MEEKFSVVGIFQNIHSAHVLKTRLESEGIEAWVTDENTVTMNPFYADKVGGAKLQVKAIDADKALEIINSIQEARLN